MPKKSKQDTKPKSKPKQKVYVLLGSALATELAASKPIKTSSGRQNLADFLKAQEKNNPKYIPFKPKPRKIFPF